MLKDFSKLSTFLTVVETRSFSKASKKLGISQPAVTQQIKLIEDFLKRKIIDRKKSGIILTPEGEELKKIALKLKKSIENAEKELLKVIDDDLPIRIGACMTIGEYVFPTILNQVREQFESDIVVTVEQCKLLEDKLRDKRVDIALMAVPSFLDGITYKEWIDDEIVIFSNRPMPESVTPKELSQYTWVYREEDSHTRRITQEIFESKGVDCSNVFDDVQTVFNNVTAVKNTVLKSPKDGKQVVSLISRCVIEEELKSGLLYATKVKGCSFNRKFYLAYMTHRKDEETIKSLGKYLLTF